MNLKLVIGNKNYSTWSLRPWFLLKAFNIQFEEIHVSLASDHLREDLLEFSPAAKVPVLLERELRVWDSLAICEYVNEVHLEGKGWPRIPLDRARARALVCEMHSGYFALRSEMPMNIRAQRKVPISESLQQDIERIEMIWSQPHKSGWLFETFSIADCFFAPVALRFQTYGVELGDPATDYMNRLLDHPAIKVWVADADNETEVVQMGEAGDDGSSL